MYGSDDHAQLHNGQRSQMVNDHHFNRVVKLIEDATAKGATVIHGGTWDASSRRTPLSLSLSLSSLSLSHPHSGPSHA